MPDFEKLIKDLDDQKNEVDCEDDVVSVKVRKRKSKRMRDRDDFSGMFLHMSKKIDPRELFIIWVVFLFLHTEMFAEHILKRFSGTTNDDLSKTMKGTIYSSVLMMLVVVLCCVIF